MVPTMVNLLIINILLQVLKILLSLPEIHGNAALRHPMRINSLRMIHEIIFLIRKN